MSGIRTVQPSGRVASRYFKNLSPYQCIMGPVGSGKSTTNVMKLLSLAMFQPRDPHDGVRRSRWAVIRNTKTQLNQTTIKTFHDYIPETYGRFRENNGSISHEFSLRHDDGSRADVEVLFIPLDKEEDVQRLLSLELTGAFINEAREVPGGLINSLYARTGRYPSVANGGCFWHGIMMDTNSFDVDNWIYKKFVEAPADGWAFFRQPSGLSAEAENRENLIPGYYENLCVGSPPEWVDMYVHAKFGYSRDGKPVFPMFSDHVHVAKEILRPVPGLKIQMGFDAGRTPACVFGQTAANGQKRILAEFFMEKTGPVEFSRKLKEFIGRRFGADVQFSERNWADPASAMGDSKTDPSWINVVRRETGFTILPCPGDNAIGPRLDAVAANLSELIDGEPAFVLSPDCSILRKGFNSGYCYRRVRSSSGEAFEDVPDKNRFSHLMDALQYLCLGDGGYEKAVGFKPNRKARGVILTHSDTGIFKR